MDNVGVLLNLTSVNYLQSRDHRERSASKRNERTTNQILLARREKNLRRRVKRPASRRPDPAGRARRTYSRFPPGAPEATGVIPPAASVRLNAGTSLSISWRYSTLAAARSFSIMSVKLN